MLLKESLPCDGCKGFFSATRLSQHRCFLRSVSDSLSNNSSVKSARVFLAVNACDGRYREVYEKIISGIKDADLRLLI